MVLVGARIYQHQTSPLSPPQLLSVTGQGGKAQVPLFNQGRFPVYVQAGGHLSADVVLEAGKTNEVRLSRGERISGKVLWHDWKTGARGVELALRRIGDLAYQDWAFDVLPDRSAGLILRGRSGPDGAFEIGGAVPGHSYALTLETPGLCFHSGWQPTPVRAGASGVAVIVSAWWALAIDVRNEDTENPIHGAFLNMISREATVHLTPLHPSRLPAGLRGFFHRAPSHWLIRAGLLDDVSLGEKKAISVSVEAPGYVGKKFPWPVEPFVEDIPVIRLNLKKLKDTGWLVPLVRDQLGMPLDEPDAGVMLKHRATRVQVKLQRPLGRAWQPVLLPVGEYTFRDGRGVHRFEIHKDVRVEVELWLNTNSRLRIMARNPDGRSLESFFVTIRGKARVIQTEVSPDSWGRPLLSLRDLVSGSYDIRVRRPGYADFSTSVTLNEGDPMTTISAVMTRFR